MHISWLTDGSRKEELTELFLASVHPQYMSHGDLMEGRAVEPGRWADDLAVLHARELADLQLDGGAFSRPGMRVALAEGPSGLLGFALVASVAFDTGRAEPIRYARLDDVVVAPSSRSVGTGAALIAWVERQLREASIPRIFLESGIHNTRAHAFFLRNGFAVTSLTMMKEL
jgi:GNAT superfamily N-acetyltransferase